MEYSSNVLENEKQKVANGQRNLVTIDKLEAWLTNDYDLMTELVLDIINGSYAVADVVKDIKEYN